MVFIFLETFADSPADADGLGASMTQMGAGAIEIVSPGELTTRWRVRGCFDAAKVDATKTTPPGYRWIEPELKR